METPTKRPLLPFPPNSATSQRSFLSSTSTSMDSAIPSSAPTPFNTYQVDDVDAFGSSSVVYDESPSLPSRHTSTSFSSQAHLLSSRTISTSDIPQSNRPIPGPPLSLPSTTSFAPESLPTPPIDTKLHDLEARKGDDRDTIRLQQLGYDPVLGRDYTFWSSLSIAWLNIGALQGTIYAVSGAYSYGGPIMILVAWPFSGIFSLFLTLTMSELASAYPVSGAMASWAWKCARGGVGGERYWGWLMGGVVLGGHVGNLLLLAWEICKIVAGTMALAFDYHQVAWHSVLFFLAILLVCGTVGSTAWGRSPKFWLASGVYGLSVWFILCVILLVTATSRPHSATAFTTQFYNRTGWGNQFYVYLLGWQFCTIATGADVSAHMSEETRNPARNVPNAMTASMILTYVLGYISIVLLLLAIDPADAAVIADHSFPVGYILIKATNESGAVAILCLLIVVILIQFLAQLQASSRFVFALARDQAMPFSDVIKRTSGAKQPVIANWLVIALCLPFAALLSASESTLYSVLAVTASTLSYFGYIVPVILYLLSKKDLQLEGRTSWSLRKWSKPVGIVGVIYALFVIVAQTFPGGYPVTAETISWSPVVLVGSVALCALTWKCYGDKNYSGPIRALTKWQTGVEIDLQSTLASRSRASAPRDSDLGPKVSDQSKLGLTPFFTDSVIHTVTVGSAGTLETGASTGWTSGTESGSTRSTVTRDTGSRVEGSLPEDPTETLDESDER